MFKKRLILYCCIAFSSPCSLFESTIYPAPVNKIHCTLPADFRKIRHPHWNTQQFHLYRSSSLDFAQIFQCFYHTMKSIYVYSFPSRVLPHRMICIYKEKHPLHHIYYRIFNTVRLEHFIELRCLSDHLHKFVCIFLIFQYNQL